MSEAVPLYLPEGSLGLFRVIAKNQGHFLSSLGAAVDLCFLSTLGLLPSIAAVFWFLKAALCRLPHSLLPNLGAGGNISFLTRSGRSRISLSALPRLSCTPDFQVNLAGQPNGFKADSEHPAPWTMVQTMPWPLFPPAYILCCPQGPFKPPLFLHPSLDSSHTPASGTRWPSHLGLTSPTKGEAWRLLWRPNKSVYTWSDGSVSFHLPGFSFLVIIHIKCSRIRLYSFFK